MIAEATKWDIRLLSCNIVFKITVVGEISDFSPVKPLHAMCPLCFGWCWRSKPNFVQKNIWLQARSGAQNQSTDRRWTQRFQIKPIDALQLLISAIARFCDIKTIRSLWGSNPHWFATCRGQPLNERGYLGEPSKRRGFYLLIQDLGFISAYVSSIDDSGLHYDWKAAKMMVNSAYISLSNISDVMEKTFLDLMCHGQLCDEHGYLGWLS